jgi:hypothetical protein
MISRSLKYLCSYLVQSVILMRRHEFEVTINTKERTLLL